MSAASERQEQATSLLEMIDRACRQADEAPGCSLPASTSATVILPGITNPSAGNFPAKKFGVTTSEDQAVVSPGTGITINPVTAPATPTGVVVTALNAQVGVSWTASTSNGGSKITSYTATARTSTNALGGTCKATGAATFSCTISGLTNGTTYTVKVKATNAVGSSVPSIASSPVTPLSGP